MRKLICLSAVLLAVMAMVSCSGSTSTPSSAFEKYSSGMISGDYDKFVEGVYLSQVEPEKQAEYKENLKIMIESKGKASMEKKGGLKEIVIISEEISEDGNSAVVKFKQVFGDGSEEEEDQKMVKVDDKWLMDIGK